MSEAPAGLYLHVPFCDRVCPYCDFAVRTGDLTRRRRYVEHLLAEIELYAGDPLSFDTIYFGGGTPSTLEPGDLGRVLDRLRGTFRLDDSTLVYLEVNPEHVSPASVAAWRALGVDTISLGVQSLDPQVLSFLGRGHDARQARRAVELAREAGFGTVSVDLIYGLPGQSGADWRREMDRALDLGAHHFSCYQLTVHRGTRFGLLEKRGKLTQLPSDAQAELFRLTHRHFEAHGFQGYEVSQFAADPRHRSRHNLKYWDHTPYLGLGPSAHSFRERQRWWNIRRTDPWQARIDQGRRPIEETETLDARALALESLMLGLRTHAGVDLQRLQASHGIDLLASNADVIERLESSGLVSVVGDRLVPTLDGLAVADSLALHFEL